MFKPGDLRLFAEAIHSQSGEDGIIAEIFKRINVTNYWFVEFGASDGRRGNCRVLAQNGWNGLLIESNRKYIAALRKRYLGYRNIKCMHALVSSKNIEIILRTSNIPTDFDLLSIDIDGNDYWIWKAIKNWQPRVVVIEYNGSYPPPKLWVMTENARHKWDGTDYYGASLASMARLGDNKNYTLVGTDPRGINAFFVRKELVNDKFLIDDVEYHYSPPRFGKRIGGGHPHRNGPHLKI